MNSIVTFRKILPAIICILWINPAFSQQNSLSRKTLGIGLKFNNPSGITIKKYFKDKAIELTIGTFSSWNNYRHYYRRLRHDYRDQNFTFIDYDPIHYPLMIQLHYLVHRDITWFRGFRWYHGIGAQFRRAEYYYAYSYQNGAVTVNAQEKINYIGLGIDAVAGLEYTFKNFPLSVFYDANIYVEALEQPLYMKLQSGLGLRYNF